MNASGYDRGFEEGLTKEQIDLYNKNGYCRGLFFKVAAAIHRLGLEKDEGQYTNKCTELDLALEDVKRTIQEVLDSL